jgi:hypothetical protein
MTTELGACAQELRLSSCEVQVWYVNDQLEATVSWSLCELALIPGYLAAVVAQSSGLQLCLSTVAGRRDDADPQFFHAAKRVRKV